MARETRATSAGAGSGRAKSVIASLRSVYRSRCRWDGASDLEKSVQRDIVIQIRDYLFLNRVPRGEARRILSRRCTSRRRRRARTLVRSRFARRRRRHRLPHSASTLQRNTLRTNFDCSVSGSSLREASLRRKRFLLPRRTRQS